MRRHDLKSNGEAQFSTDRQRISTDKKRLAEDKKRAAKRRSGNAYEMKRDEQRSKSSEMKNTALCRIDKLRSCKALNCDVLHSEGSAQSSVGGEKT